MKQEENNPKSEINLIEIIKILKLNRFLILLFTFFCSFCAIVYSLYLPNLYISESSVELQPLPSTRSESSGGSINSLLMNISSPNSSVREKFIAEKKIFSRDFFRVLHADKDFIINLTNNSFTKIDIKDVNFEESFDLFKSRFKFNESKIPGIIKLSFIHEEKKIARDLLYSTYENFNEFMSINTLNESENSLDFLEKSLSSTKIPEVRNVLSQLIKKEYQDITFAKQKHFFFKFIETPEIPTQRYSPQRSIICIITFALSLLLISFIVLFMNLLKVKTKVIKYLD